VNENEFERYLTQRARRERILGYVQAALMLVVLLGLLVMQIYLDGTG
jgi:hypothetical protein